jgi:glutamyl/glutaminyl-tRNA synthetase
MLHVHASVIRPVEESLREFEDMRNGKYRANEATLRMKMDMLSPNPNMWDQVGDLFQICKIWCHSMLPSGVGV